MAGCCRGAGLAIGWVGGEVVSVTDCADERLESTSGRAGNTR